MPADLTGPPGTASAALSRLKYWASRGLTPKVYWNLMGRLKPVPAVTSAYTDVESCLASGAEVVALLDGFDVVRPDAVTLQIGSGLGRVEYHLRHRVERCFGIDISASMVKRARELVPFPNVEFFETDGSGLGRWPDESFDLVYSFFAFQHMPRMNFHRYVGETFAKLRPGGHFVFQLMIDEAGTMPDPPAAHPYGLRYYRRGDVIAQLTASGFENIRLGDMSGRPDDGRAAGDVVFWATMAEAAAG